MVVKIGVVPFSKSGHRFSSSNLVNDFLTTVFENCRMIKDNILQIDLKSISFDLLNRCNYLSYCYDNKNYYCFINSVDYVNDNVANVSIEKDYFTTFIDSLTFKNSYVERIHPPSYDADFTQVTEGLKFNDSELIEQGFFPYELDKFLVGCTHCIPYDKTLPPRSLLEVANPFPSWVACPTLCGIVQGCVWYVLDSFTQVSNVIANANNFGYTSSVTGIYKVSSTVIKSNTQVGHGTYYPNGTLFDETKVDFTVNILTSSQSMEINRQKNATLNIDGMSINNKAVKYKKCFSDEFCKYYLKNDKQINFYNPSDFDNPSQVRFDEYTSNNQYQNVTISPFGYKHQNYSDFMDGLSITLSLSGTLSSDNTVKEVNDVVARNNQGTLDCISSILTQGTGAIGGILNTVITQGVDTFSHVINPLANSSTIFGSNCNGVASQQLPITNRIVHYGISVPTASDIDKIDKYFSKYGYQVNEILTPYLRGNYTFIKGDIDFTINGNLTAYEYIKSLFSIGLTIWSTKDMFTYDV